MRAALYRRTGPAAEVLSIEQLPDPLPGPGEVRIRVACSGVNPSDVKARGGVSSTTLAWPYVVPHSDGSGVVDMVGEGVALTPGTRVWFWFAQWQRQHGSAADYVCLPAQQVGMLPDGLPLQAGASIGIPLMSALHAVQGYGELRGKTVLVSGGAGAVGFYAIQLARRAGATVLATASGEAKATLAVEAGAQHVLPYADGPALAAAVRSLTNGRGVDAIIEVNASDNAALYPELLADGGQVIVYGSRAAEIPLSYRGMMRVFGSVHFFIVYLLPAGRVAQIARTIEELLREGALKHLPVREFALEDIASAHRHVEAGTIGKAIICLS